MKSRDDYARPGSAIIEEAPRSVKSKKVIETIREPAPAREKASPLAESAPTDFHPQLATWVASPPLGEQWLHEVKFDGYRLIAHIQDGKVKLITRGNHDWTHRFPRLAEELDGFKGNLVLDGEVVVLDEKGCSQFQLLQNAWKAPNTSDPILYLFDLLYRDGEDLRSRPLLERKEQLEKLIKRHGAGRVKYSDHVRGNGGAVVDAACKMHLEGIISKQADSPYRAGRTTTWLKSKCDFRQEFVIIGYTDPKGSRQDFRAILLGYHDKDGKLVYAGRVGTGFDRDLLKEIKREMVEHHRPTPATHTPPPARERSQAHWIAPKLVAEIKFAGWTVDRMIRQGTFLGLRKDKSAAQVTREDDAAPKLTHRRVKSVKSSATSVDAKSSPLTLTHPDRVIFPDVKITKADLAAYYETVADRMLPHVIDRPLTLLRCPGGVGSSCFFQRHFTPNLPPTIESIDVPNVGTNQKQMIIRDAAGLRALVQINALEIHAWGCTIADIEKPDRLVFDLDPDTKLPWSTVVKAARDLRRILESVKLKPLVKTSGGKGLHIVVPIKPDIDWNHAKAFCKSIADAAAQADPKSYTTNMRKSQRNGRIFIDYLRNGRSATAIVPYSVRARAGAPVSMPVDWEELPRLGSANAVTVPNIRKRLSRPDPWANYESHRADLHAITSTREKS
jgi:bifunctional non-homologous end joining protein LigD